MATSIVPGARKLASLLVALACAAMAVLADDVSTSAEQNVPDWAADNAMQLTLSTTAGDWLPLQYTVIPLTENLGLNESGRVRGIIQIDGHMIAADASNYNTITDSDDVAYLSCDEPKDDSFIEPNKILNELMQIRPRAIVLYSKSRNWCSLHHGVPLSYTSILSMADAAEATQALGYLNGTSSGSDVKVSITGNTTDNNSGGSESEPDSSGNKSAVAMSILYSITGLITLLFLIIIATGAVRAHRYPERYGPRRAHGGRPRQSRAKGLARAVLDTIPIVKFGNQTPPKPDPELELETGTTDGRDTQRTISNLSEEGKPDATNAHHVTAAAVPSTHAEGDGASSGARDSGAVEGNEEEQLGCSICTEDFKVGEDVRVLPCGHRFHPTCIDPWLINVSGTCPLCRYDLRPGQADASERSGNEGGALPPPLALGDEADGSSNAHRTRFSRIFNINQLRQATVEEQMAALRQMRAQTTEAEHQETDGEARGQRARFADKLKERFRIRTRAQSAEERHED